MQQPCPHCDQPNTSLLRLVLIGEILRADESQLVLLADVMYRCGLLPLSDAAEEPEAVPVKPRQGTLHTLRRSGADHQKAVDVRFFGRDLLLVYRLVTALR